MANSVFSLPCASMCIGSVELCVYTEHDLNESLFPHFSDKF